MWLSANPILSNPAYYGDLLRSGVLLVVEGFRVTCQPAT